MCMTLGIGDLDSFSLWVVLERVVQRAVCPLKSANLAYRGVEELPASRWSGPDIIGAARSVSLVLLNSYTWLTGQSHREWRRTQLRSDHGPRFACSSMASANGQNVNTSNQWNASGIPLEFVWHKKVACDKVDLL